MFPHLQLNITAQMPEIGVLCNEPKKRALANEKWIFFVHPLHTAVFSFSSQVGCVSHCACVESYRKEIMFSPCFLFVCLVKKVVKFNDKRKKIIQQPRYIQTTTKDMLNACD